MQKRTCFGWYRRLKREFAGFGMSEERKRSKWRTGFSVAATLILMPLAYALSYAPYMWLRFGADPNPPTVAAPALDAPYWLVHVVDPSRWTVLGLR